jgi:CubicO group peptidase (beta-lactamase class C family)
MNLFSKSAAASLLMLAAAQAKLPIAQPEEIGVASQQLEHIGAIINTAITKQSLPGAVVLIGCHGKVIYRKAFGNKSLEPHIVSMQEDTIFDLASLTKVVATTTSIMMLVERGLVRLGEPVATYIPEFGQNGKEKITVEQLLLHTGGFAPDFNFSKDFNLMQASKKITDITPEELRAQFYSRAPDYPPGTQCIYSCLSFLVLGELITRISKQTLDSFCYENIFQPLNMTDTMFLLDNKRMLRAAPQDKKTVSWLSGNVNNPRNNLDKPAWLYGKVHDPKASLLGGVAGTAGLF